MDVSMTHWIAKVKSGDEEAAEHIWQRYFPDLVRLARQQLQSSPRRVVDEEDVALSALDSFCKAAQNNRFPELNDSPGLWRLLSEMTRRKAVDLIRSSQRLKVGGGRVRGDSVFAGGAASLTPGLDMFSSTDPTPELALQLAEDCQQMLAALEDDELRRIALFKLDGRSNQEIGELLGCTKRTVERRLFVIRRKWEHLQP